MDMKIGKMRWQIVAGAGLVAGMVLGASSSSLLAEDDPPVGQIDQGFHVDSPSGELLEVRRATFSGTETRVEVGVVVDGGGEQYIDTTWVHAEGLGPALGRERHVASESGAILLFGALADGVQTGTAKITIERVLVRRPSGNVEVHGPWYFELKRPKSSELETALRTEVLATSVAVGGDPAPASVRVTRSTTETIVEYPIPLGGWEVAQPQLTTGGAPIKGPVASGPIDNTTMVARFPATDFGEDVQLTIGPFEVASSAATQVVDISAASVVAPGMAPAQSAELPAPVLAAQYRGRVVEGAHLLDVTLDGSWPPEVAQLELRDEHGTVLKTSALEIDYSKDNRDAIQRERTRLVVKIPLESYGGSFSLLLSAPPSFIPEVQASLLAE